ncbi:MAG: hypothetical protein ACN23H_02430 [Candidatus Phytoplasma vitis]|nr:MAG: hypothetical protein M6G77_01680 [Candidatus Phytoplasma vitis]
MSFKICLNFKVKLSSLLILFFTIISLDIIVIIFIKDPKGTPFVFVNNNILNCFLEGIFYGIFVFFIRSIYAYIFFKITKGPRFIYKYPIKEKEFEYYPFSQSIVMDSSIYARQTTSSHNLYKTISGLLAIILLIVSIITKFQYIQLFKSFMVVAFISYIYFTIVLFANLWLIYVKFFKWLGFSWFEKDFNKTIAKNNYFLISKQYYEKQNKQEKKQAKINFIIWYLFYSYLLLKMLIFKS